MPEFTPKHSIRNTEKFQEDRGKMGNFIHQGMNVSGGTDIDWLVERNGGFIVMENKTFSDDIIVITVGQMIAFENMYKKLNSDGRCHFLFFGADDIDFNDQDSKLWYFDMQEFVDKKIKFTKTEFKNYSFHRDNMKPITIKGYRDLMEKYWNEFGDPDSPNITFFETQEKLKTQQKLENIPYADIVDEIRKKHPSAYKPWTESDLKLLENFWRDNSTKQSESEKISEIMKRFGRNENSIKAKLHKLGFLPDYTYPKKNNSKK